MTSSWIFFWDVHFCAVFEGLLVEAETQEEKSWRGSLSCELTQDFLGYFIPPASSVLFFVYSGDSGELKASLGFTNIFFVVLLLGVFPTVAELTGDTHLYFPSVTHKRVSPAVRCWVPVLELGSPFYKFNKVQRLGFAVWQCLHLWV